MEYSERITDKAISATPWILKALQQFPANAIRSVATNPCSAGLNSQSSASGNQAECTIWQIDAHLDANVTSLSVRKFGDLEIVGHVGYQLYSALQLKVSSQFLGPFFSA